MSSLPDARYSIREGDLFAGKYRIDRELGAGGMGVVVLAHHIELDDRVAIKFLLPEVLNHGEAVARFFREAQAAAKIKSEHVARVRDVGSLDNGAPYMVMEFLEGEDLGNWVEQKGRTDIWALGAILYELTTGVPPFAATSIPELVMKLLTTSQAPVASVRPELPAAVAQALDSLIGRCLEKDRERRFATVTDFARALAPLAPSRARVSLERIAGVLPGAEVAAARPEPVLASTASGQTVAARSTSRLPVRGRALWFAAPVLLGAFAWIVRTNTHRAPAASDPNAQLVPSSAPAAFTGQVASETPLAVAAVVPPPATAAVASSVPARATERATRAPKVVKKTTRRPASGKVDVYDDRK